MIFRGILLSVYRENAVKAFKNEKNEEFLIKGPTKAKFYATYILIKYQKNWKSKKQGKLRTQISAVRSRRFRDRVNSNPIGIIFVFICIFNEERL